MIEAIESRYNGEITESMSLSDSPSNENKPACIKMLQDILDGDASFEEQARFKMHIEKCIPCYREYKLEMTIRGLLKSKCSESGVPPDLIYLIRNQIENNRSIE